MLSRASGARRGSGTATARFNLWPSRLSCGRPNAALGQALSHRREDRNAIAAGWRPAASMIAVVNCDSHNYLLDMPISENTDSDIYRSLVQNISTHGASVFNIGRWRGRDPIQTIARRIAKRPGKPPLVIGGQNRTTELIPRYGRTRMNIVGLLRGAGVGEEIALQQAIDYTRKCANAAARLALSGTFAVSIRERR